MKIITYLILCSLLLLPILAFAKDEKSYVDLKEDVVSQVIAVVRPIVKRLKINTTDLVGEETPEQLADPLINAEQAEEAIVRGIISATAEWCKLDWEKRSFLPYMAEKRKEERGEKPMAYTGALHGYGMSIAERIHKGKECGEADRKKIGPYLY